MLIATATPHVGDPALLLILFLGSLAVVLVIWALLVLRQ